MNTETRIAELETRLTFQEHAMTELSDALAQARLETERLTRAVKRIAEELAGARGAGVSMDASDEPPPPHY